MSNRVMNAIKRPWIIVLTVVVCVLFITFFFLSHDMLEIPALDDIDSMQAQIRGDGAQGPLFTVVPEDYQLVLSSLIPGYCQMLLTAS
jgi:hypothetical protein